MEKSRLITRRNRATVNRILGAFRVRWSYFAVHSKKTRQRPLFFDQIVESTKIIFASGLTVLRKSADLSTSAWADIRTETAPGYPR
jgi:hypothetical protein